MKRQKKIINHHFCCVQQLHVSDGHRSLWHRCLCFLSSLLSCSVIKEGQCRYFPRPVSLQDSDWYHVWQPSLSQLQVVPSNNFDSRCQRSAVDKANTVACWRVLSQTETVKRQRQEFRSRAHVQLSTQSFSCNHCVPRQCCYHSVTRLCLCMKVWVKKEKDYHNSRSRHHIRYI